MNKKVFIIAIIVLVIDQLSKMIANMYLVDNIVTIIPNFFKLEYALNTGAAWSILNSHQVIIIVISIILMIILFMINKNFKNNIRNNIAFGLVFGGIWGNLVDRIFHGYVIDFLSFKIFNYNYPIFNVADIAVVLGILLLIFAVIKGEDNENSSKRKSN